MKYFLVLNPGSHAGKSRKMFDRLFALLTASALDFDYQVTRTLDDARRLSKEANEKGYDAVVAVGGDGTINGVINGFYDSQGKRISKAKFGVIYTGTSPDFCKSYNIPLALEEAVSRLANPRVIPVPIGRITLSENRPSDNGDPSLYGVVRYFACCANIGLGAALARRANGGIRNVLGDFAGTLVSLIVTLAGYQANNFIRIIDGKEEKVERMVNTSVGLTPFIASGIKMGFETAGIKDRFYCMTVRDLKWWQVFPLLKKVYSGKPFADSNYLTISWCREVEFGKNDRNPEVEFDGDPAGFLPCKIEIACENLDLIV
jgi:diacylglycerol kinase family enzyme